MPIKGNENQGGKCSFYRIPKLILTSPRFQSLSAEAKLLYGLMLDRANLSTCNGWADARGRVYIYFPEQQAAAMFGCSRSKAVRLFKSLNDFDLIERHRQGQGRPDRIYVKDITRLIDCHENEQEVMPIQQPEEPIGEATIDVQTAKNRQFGCYNLQLLDVTNFDRNKTDKNNIDLTNTESPSPNPSSPPQQRAERSRMERLEAFHAIIRENINYDLLLRDYGFDPELVDGCVELLAEICTSDQDTVRINREDLPIELARSRFLKLDMTHIAYAIDCLSHTATQIGSIRAYMLSVLYNAPTTMGYYYAAQTSHDAAERVWETRTPLDAM